MNSAHGPCACAARSRSNATSCSAWWHSRSIKYSASRSSGPRRPERRPLRPANTGKIRRVRWILQEARLGERADELILQRYLGFDLLDLVFQIVDTVLVVSALLGLKHRLTRDLGQQRLVLVGERVENFLLRIAAGGRSVLVDYIERGTVHDRLPVAHVHSLNGAGHRGSDLNEPGRWQNHAVQIDAAGIAAEKHQRYHRRGHQNRSDTRQRRRQPDRHRRAPEPHYPPCLNRLRPEQRRSTHSYPELRFSWLDRVVCAIRSLPRDSVPDRVTQGSLPRMRILKTAVSQGYYGRNLAHSASVRIAFLPLGAMRSAIIGASGGA